VAQSIPKEKTPPGNHQTIIVPTSVRPRRVKISRPLPDAAATDILVELMFGEEAYFERLNQEGKDVVVVKIRRSSTNEKIQ